MHGLQIYQDINSIDPMTNGDDPADSNIVEAIAWSVLSPNNLVQATIVSTVQPDRQSYIKRATLEVWFKNIYTFPVRLVSIKCKARRDLTIAAANIYSVMEDGAPLFFPYMSYTTGNTFQKLFKILKTKDRLIGGGAVKKIVRKDYQYSNRAVNADVEGNNVDYTYRKGNVVWVDIIHGTPAFCSSELPSRHIVCSRFYVITQYRYYYSWYRMDLTTPTSNITENIGNPTAYGSTDAQASKIVGGYYAGQSDPSLLVV